MADFMLSARTMNFDGLRSSWVRKVTMLILANSGRKIAKKPGGEQEGFGLPLSERVIWTEIAMNFKKVKREEDSLSCF
jgi:hypothetical protein